MSSQRLAFMTAVLALGWIVNGTYGQCENRTALVLKANETEQTFHSPNYPKKYPSNSYCEWLIEAPSVNFTVMLRIIFVDVEYFPGCAFDNITLYNGKNKATSKSHRFCYGGNYSIPTTVRYMTVVFRSDGNREGRGFEFGYRAVVKKPVVTRPPMVTATRPVPTEPKQKGVDKWVVVGGVVGGIAFIVIVALVCCGRCRGGGAPRQPPTHRAAAFYHSHAPSTPQHGVGGGGSGGSGGGVGDSPTTISTAVHMVQSSNTVFMVSSQSLGGGGGGGGSGVFPHRLTNLASGVANMGFEGDLTGAGGGLVDPPVGVPPPTYDETMLQTNPPAVPPTPQHTQGRHPLPVFVHGSAGLAPPPLFAARSGAAAAAVSASSPVAHSASEQAAATTTSSPSRDVSGQAATTASSPSRDVSEQVAATTSSPSRDVSGQVTTASSPSRDLSGQVTSSPSRDLSGHVATASSPLRDVSGQATSSPSRDVSGQVAASGGTPQQTDSSPCAEASVRPPEVSPLPATATVVRAPAQPTDIGTPEQPAAPENVRTAAQSTDIRTTAQPSGVGTPTQPSNDDTPARSSVDNTPAQPPDIGTPAQPPDVGTSVQPLNDDTRARSSVFDTPAQPPNEGTPAQPPNVGTSAPPTDVGTPAQSSNVEIPAQSSGVGTPVRSLDVGTPEQPVDVEIPARSSDVGTPEQPMNVQTSTQREGFESPVNISDAGTSAQPADGEAPGNPTRAETPAQPAESGTPVQPPMASPGTNFSSDQCQGAEAPSDSPPSPADCTARTSPSRAQCRPQSPVEAGPPAVSASEHTAESTVPASQDAGSPHHSIDNRNATEAQINPRPVETVVDTNKEVSGTSYTPEGTLHCNGRRTEDSLRTVSPRGPPVETPQLDTAAAEQQATNTQVVTTSQACDHDRTCPTQEATQTCAREAWKEAAVTEEDNESPSGKDNSTSLQAVNSHAEEEVSAEVSSRPEDRVPAEMVHQQAASGHTPHDTVERSVSGSSMPPPASLYTCKSVDSGTFTFPPPPPHLVSVSDGELGHTAEHVAGPAGHFGPEGMHSVPDSAESSVPVS
ncbi:uncharacterized protein LOC143296317 isoform X1 [Babylonia areolata]|uniref:uncharacterized protein LOC143296317 isoform X1 n=2 Tax=Babylonia areolata TaxID=304850 RepID=UPI003FD1676B